MSEWDKNIYENYEKELEEQSKYLKKHEHLDKEEKEVSTDE